MPARDNFLPDVVFAFYLRCYAIHAYGIGAIYGNQIELGRILRGHQRTGQENKQAYIFHGYLPLANYPFWGPAGF